MAEQETIQDVGHARMDDVTAIQQVLNAYSVAANLANYEDMVDTYAPDGVWEIDTYHAASTGRETILAKTREIVKKYEFFVQLNTPAHISVDGDTALASSTIRESGRLVGGTTTIEVFGHYADQLVRTEFGWKFARRRFRVLGMQQYDSRPPNFDAQGHLQQ